MFVLIVSVSVLCSVFLFRFLGVLLVRFVLCVFLGGEGAAAQFVSYAQVSLVWTFFLFMSMTFFSIEIVLFR